MDRVMRLHEVVGETSGRQQHVEMTLAGLLFPFSKHSIHRQSIPEAVREDRLVIPLLSPMTLQKIVTCCIVIVHSLLLSLILKLRSTSRWHVPLIRNDWV
jgi:hypothetical protein